MRVTPQRRAVAMAAVALGLVSGCSDADDLPERTATSTPSTFTSASASASASASSTPGVATKLIEISVSDGKVTREDVRISVAKGTQVTIRVRADRRDHVHVHDPYDLKADVAPDAPAEIAFVARIAGSVEVELEESHLLLFQLQVR